MPRDLTSSLFWLAIAIFASFEGFAVLKLGTLRSPGPGFFPFWGGILLAIFSLMLLVRSLRGREQFGFGAIQWRALLVVLGAVLAYLFLLETLGFVTVTFVFLLLLFGFGKTPWVKSGAWSAIATMLIYVLFRFWLQVQLPRGPLGL